MSTGRERTWAPGSAAVMDVLWRPGGPQISTAAKAVYSSLFSYMGADCTCHPSVATLATGTSVDGRTVQRHLSSLEAAGLVERIEQKGKVTRYRLYPPWNPRRSVTPDNMTPLTECHHRQNVTPDTVTEDPRQNVTTTPGTVSPEVTHSKKPIEVTQLSLHPAGEQPGPDHKTEGAPVEKPKAGKKAPGDGYSPEFEEFWAAYPRRKEKGKAWRVWLTRTGKGAGPDEMITAAKHYALECEADGRDEKYIKHAATFLGPDGHWREYLLPPGPGAGRRPGRTVPGQIQRPSNDMWAARREASGQ